MWFVSYSCHLIFTLLSTNKIIMMYNHLLYGDRCLDAMQLMIKDLPWFTWQDFLRQISRIGNSSKILTMHAMCIRWCASRSVREETGSCYLYHYCPCTMPTWGVSYWKITIPNRTLPNSQKQYQLCQRAVSSLLVVWLQHHVLQVVWECLVWYQLVWGIHRPRPEGMLYAVHLFHPVEPHSVIK